MSVTAPQKPQPHLLAKLAAANQNTNGDENNSNLHSNGSATPALNSAHIGKHLALIGKQASDNFHADRKDSASDNQASSEFKQQFSELANDPAAFTQLMNDVFGNDIDIAQTETFRIAALNGNFNWLPDTAFVSAENMNGAMAAYSTENNTIYINEDIKGTDLAQQYYSEEAGHFLDATLNTADTIGDEGELFQLRLSGQDVSENQINELTAENDHGTINIDGVEQTVEFGIFKKFTKWVNKKIITPVVDVIVKPIVDIAKRGIDVVVDTIEYVAEGAADVLSGHVSRGLGKLIRSPFKLAGDIIGVVYDAIIIALERAAHVVDQVFNLGDQRGLTPAEITHLTPIFGPSFDYSEIKIKTGGTWNSLSNQDGGTTIRNTVIMSASDENGAPHYDENGVLTPIGLSLLVHEVAHVWQYQQEGVGYIHSSSGEQINDNWFGGKDAYQWQHSVIAGVEFKDLKVEQQAQLIQDIGAAIHRGEFTETDFEIDGVAVDADQWRIIDDAHKAVFAA